MLSDMARLGFDNGEFLGAGPYVNSDAVIENLLVIPYNLADDTK